MSNVKDIGLEKRFPKEAELMERISEVISDYNGELSLVAVIGVLEMKKQTLITSQQP